MNDKTHIRFINSYIESYRCYHHIHILIEKIILVP